MTPVAPRHRSTQRVLDILSIFADNCHSSFSLSEIAANIGAPKSSLFPILQTMVANSVLNYDSRTQLYSLGIRIFELGMNYLRLNNAYSELTREIQEIAVSSMEASNLGELVGNEVYYLITSSSPETIRLMAAPGKKQPAHSTALGKVLLCEKNYEELNGLYPNGLASVTERTITDPDVLYEQLRTVREQGFCMEDGENDLSVYCIAIPLHVAGKIQYAVSVSLPKYRFSPEKEQNILRILKEHQSKLEAYLLAWHTSR